MTPFFSVIIPVYNRAHSILPTLESVRGQTFADFECLVIDDGSLDGEALMAVVAGMRDPRFRYIWRKNGGGGAARNTGIDAARGQFTAFLDSDDLFLSDKLERAAVAIAEDPQPVYYTQTLVERGMSDRKWTRPERAIHLGERVATYIFIFNQHIQTSTIVLDTAQAREVRFDDFLPKGQDLDFALRLDAAGARFVMLEKPTSIWFDASEVGRTSRTKGYEQPLDWLAQHEHLMTRKEIAGYKATSLAYYYAWQRPFAAAFAIVSGIGAGVPKKILVRQGLRTFMPRGLYRWFVDSFVARFGERNSDG
jgi:glycosyltransferase involved in cell wall biosynthesis